MRCYVLLVFISWALTIPYPTCAVGELENYFYFVPTKLYYIYALRHVLAGFRILVGNDYLKTFVGLLFDPFAECEQHSQDNRYL